MAHLGKKLAKKAEVIFKLYHVTNWEKTTQILANIFRSKGSQTVTFEQFTEKEEVYSVKKSHTKCAGGSEFQLFFGPLLLESLVIVFCVIFLMRYVVIINYFGKIFFFSIKRK